MYSCHPKEDDSFACKHSRTGEAKGIATKPLQQTFSNKAIANEAITIKPLQTDVATLQNEAIAK